MEGEIYTEVDASVLNPGISTMAMISGNPEPIDESAIVVVWLRWKYDPETGQGGFTGVDWYFEDSNISKYYSTLEEFKNWLARETPSSLDSVLSDWPAGEKADFLNKYKEILSAADCLYFGAS